MYILICKDHYIYICPSWRKAINWIKYYKTIPDEKVIKVIKIRKMRYKYTEITMKHKYRYALDVLNHCKIKHDTPPF